MKKTKNGRKRIMERRVEERWFIPFQPRDGFSRLMPKSIFHAEQGYFLAEAYTIHDKKCPVQY